MRLETVVGMRIEILDGHHRFLFKWLILKEIQPVPWKMRLEMIVEMQIEILNDAEILGNRTTKITIRICTGRYRGIQIQSKSHFELVPRDKEEFEFLDFD